MNQEAVQWLVQRRFVNPGDRVILAKGDLRERREPGGTNTLKVILIE